MKKHNHYETLFRKNKNTGRVIIDIALGDYIEFFNEWDNSAFKMRDIHSDLVRFLDLCSDYIPLRKKIEIVFSIEKGEADKEKEDSIRISYSNYYNAFKRLESRKTKRYIRMSIILLIISLILLTSYGFFNLLSGQGCHFICFSIVRYLIGYKAPVRKHHQGVRVG
jgi:hypothetical protein